MLGVEATILNKNVSCLNVLWWKRPSQTRIYVVSIFEDRTDKNKYDCRLSVYFSVKETSLNENVSCLYYRIQDTCVNNNVVFYYTI